MEALSGGMEKTTEDDKPENYPEEPTPGQNPNPSVQPEGEPWTKQ